MTISYDGSYTGLTTFTGLTTPTYTAVADTSPANPRVKQIAVTTLGGTQTGVRTSTLGDPFTFGYTPPASPKSTPQANAITGKYPPIPYNVHTISVKKGMTFASGQNPLPGWFEGRFGIPAGAESNDTANIMAMVCFLQAVLTEIAPGLANTIVTNIP